MSCDTLGHPTIFSTNGETFRQCRSVGVGRQKLQCAATKKPAFWSNAGRWFMSPDAMMSSRRLSMCNLTSAEPCGSCDRSFLPEHNVEFAKGWLICFHTCLNAATREYQWLTSDDFFRIDHPLASHFADWVSKHSALRWACCNS